MELKQFSHRELKAINNGKLPGFQNGIPSLSTLLKNDSRNYVDAPQDDPYANNPNLSPKTYNANPSDPNIKAFENAAGVGNSDNTKDIKSPDNKWGKAKVSDWQTSFAALPGLVGSMYGAFTDYNSKDEYIAQYRPVPANIAGVGYQKMTNAKNGKLPGCASGAVGNIAGATASGAAMGSVAGPWGAAIGGAVGLVGSTIGEIFSAGKDKENKEIAARYMRNVNSSNEGGALSLAMQIANSKKYGNQYDQSLWGHADGKIPGFENGLASATGPVNGEATARVSNGEVIANKWLGTMYRVPGLKNNKDGKLAALNNSDTVITNKYGLSDYAWRTGDIAGAEKMMQVLTKPNYRCGKLPNYVDGLDQLDVDLRSDTTRQGIHEGNIPYGAGNTGVAASPLYLLDANITGNPNIITGEAPNPASKWANIQDILKARKAASVVKQGRKAVQAYNNDQNAIQLQNKLNEISDAIEFSPKLRSSSDGASSIKANGKKQWMPPYRYGKLPKCAEGWLGNGIPAMLGSIAGLGQYIQAKNSKPYYPSTYSVNPYETEALTTLAGLRINPFPITQQLRNAEARTKNAIDSAGGLSGGQRAAARLAALNTTQGNISKLLSDVQQQNNAYRANYAQAAINAGQASRQARMQANQWDLDYYSKAHAARNKGIQTGIANMLAQIQQYQANEFKRRQFNETMDLYRDDMKQRQQHMQWLQDQSTRGIGLDPLYDDQTTPLKKINRRLNYYRPIYGWNYGEA